MANRRQYLEWHGQQWRVRIKVPRDVRDLIGKTKLIHPLHTADLDQASRMKWPAVSAFKQQIEEARRSKRAGEPYLSEALAIRMLGRTDPEAAQTAILERIDSWEERTGATMDEQSEFVDVAAGHGTPLDDYADAFETHKNYRTKSAQDFRRVLDWLKVWLKSSGEGTVLEDMNRKVAGRFIEQHLAAGRGRKKASAYLGFLREYWRYLVHRGHVEENPWAGQEIPSEPRRVETDEEDSGKRPYTDRELLILLEGPAPGYLGDLMRVAALSGMRIEEICQLRVRDCEGDAFKVRMGKTANAARSVPIHSSLSKIMEKRLKGKTPEAYLFHELPKPPPSRDGRSDPASKRFGHYRRKLGLDERPNDKRNSNIDFHSFRRWFIRQARDGLETADGAYGPWSIADVVGHDDEGIKNMLSLTMRTYPGKASVSSMRACVEAVRLPVAEASRTSTRSR